MTRIASTNRDRFESGVALLELAIILPLLVFIVFNALEFARLSRVIQVSVVLAREAVSWSYRSCGDFDEPGGWSLSVQRTTECLQKVVNTGDTSPAAPSILSLARQLEPAGDFSIIVSVYRSGESGGPLRLVSIAGEEADRGRVTRFQAVGNELQGPVTLDAAAVRRRGRIAVAEIYYPFFPIFRGVPTLGSVLGRFDYYDAALL